VLGNDIGGRLVEWPAHPGLFHFETCPDWPVLFRMRGVLTARLPLSRNPMAPACHGQIAAIASSASLDIEI